MLAKIGYVIAGLLLIGVPGFLFSVALYPNRKSLGFWERTGVSIGLGILVVIYEVATLAKLKSMTLEPFLAMATGVGVTLGVMAIIRKGTGAVQEYIEEIRIGLAKIGGRIPKPVKKMEKPSAPIEQKCEACGEANPLDVVYCIYCGNPLKKPQESEKSDVQVQASDSGAV